MTTTLAAPRGPLLPFSQPVPPELLDVAKRSPMRALPRRRPRGLRVALLAAWAVLCGVV